MKQYEIQIKKEIFPGFYNTIFDPSEFEVDEEDDPNAEITNEQYKEYQDKVCQGIIDLLKEWEELKVISWELFSPKAYNYQNDELYVTIETTPENILKLAIQAEDNLFDYINFDNFEPNSYHEALLEELIMWYLYKYYEEIQELAIWI